MKKLILKNRQKKNVVIVLFVTIVIIAAFFFIMIATNYDLCISIKMNNYDITSLEKRLKVLKINNFKLIEEGENKVKLYMKKNNIEHKDMFNILFSNHFYEVYLVDYSFNEELNKYIFSNYVYEIDWNSVLEVPFLEGKDIELVKTSKTRNNLNELLSITEIKYTDFGKDKNEKANLNKGKLILTFLDKQFWAFSKSSSTGDLRYGLYSNNKVLERFKREGKNYSSKDIKIITQFSKHNFKYPINIISVEGF